MKLIDQNNSQIIQELELYAINLNYNIEFPDVKIDFKCSPLALACYKGNMDVVKILLENEEIDINFPTYSKNFTPLQISCKTGHYEIFCLLITAGANINTPNYLNFTALFLCFERIQEENYFSYENKNICFNMAKKLLELGADINFIYDKENNINYLMKICNFKSRISEKSFQTLICLVQFLIENGINKVLIVFQF